jgi:hypothetical protein
LLDASVIEEQHLRITKRFFPYLLLANVKVMSPHRDDMRRSPTLAVDPFRLLSPVAQLISWSNTSNISWPPPLPCGRLLVNETMLDYVIAALEGWCDMTRIILKRWQTLRNTTASRGSGWMRGSQGNLVWPLARRKHHPPGGIQDVCFVGQMGAAAAWSFGTASRALRMRSGSTSLEEI